MLVDWVEYVLKEEIPLLLLPIGINVLIACVVLIIGIQAIRLIRKISKKAMNKMKVDMGVTQFLDSLIKIILYIILFVFIGTFFGLQVTSIVALLGSLGVTIGLALQGSLSNLAGGVLILITKPFKVGDYIIEDSCKNEGVVTEIQFFFTTLTTVDDKLVVIPNGKLANNSLTNFSTTNQRRVDITVDISYDADIKKVRELISEIIDSDSRVIDTMDKTIFVNELASSSVNMGVSVFTLNANYLPLRRDLLEKIKICLDENNITIPYPQMDVHIKNNG